jgi:hypothetical protein
MKRDTIEKIIVATFDTVAFITFCFFANLLNGLVAGILFFTIFGLINRLLPDNKRIHADRLLHCFILSIMFLLYCVIVYKIALLYMSNTESIIISICLVGLANITTSEFLWWKRNDLNKRVYEWVKFNQDNILLKEYKKKLEETDKKKYYIFIYYFEEQKSYETISKIMDIDRQRIGEEISIMSHYIEYGIRLK